MFAFQAALGGAPAAVASLARLDLVTQVVVEMTFGDDGAVFDLRSAAHLAVGCTCVAGLVEAEVGAPWTQTAVIAGAEAAVGRHERPNQGGKKHFEK